jgi:hypothetical protein
LLTSSATLQDRIGLAVSHDLESSCRYATAILLELAANNRGSCLPSNSSYGQNGEWDAIDRWPTTAAHGRKTRQPGCLFCPMNRRSQLSLISSPLRSRMLASSGARTARRTPFIPRHFYAVNALRNGVGVFEVARNIGNCSGDHSGVLGQAGDDDSVCNEAARLRRDREK